MKMTPGMHLTARRIQPQGVIPEKGGKKWAILHQIIGALNGPCYLCDGINVLVEQDH